VVYIDANGNNIFDNQTSEFTQSTPVNILDFQTSTSQINVSGSTQHIQDLNVRLNITHSFDSDLKVELVAPDATKITLFSGVGGSGQNFTNTVLDDEATTSIVVGAAPFTGSFKPANALSVFDGKIPNGTWELRVTDSSEGETGTLVNWSLIPTLVESFVTTEDDGFYAFPSLPVGTYAIRSDVQAGWSGTSPVDREYSVTIDPTNHFENLNYGAGKQNRAYTRVIHDLDQDGQPDSNESGMVGQFVFDDANGNGNFDFGPTAFSNNVDFPVPDLTTVLSPVTVSGVSGKVFDVNVRVNIQHTWDEDLDVFLVAPNGTRVELFTDVGGEGDNFTNTILDDEAGIGIASGSPPFTGSFRPEGSLAVLDGMDPNGNWNLEVSDDESGDHGVLQDWEITITAGETGKLTDKYGNAYFDLPLGNHALKLIEPVDYNYTLPADGTISVTASGLPIFGKTFGAIDETDGPTDIVLAPSSLPENAGVNANVGLLTTQDINPLNTYTYTLVSGTGDTDNTSFNITGSTLRENDSFNFEVKSSYTVRIRTTSQSNAFFEKAFTIAVTDVNENPTLDSISDASYNEDTPEITVPLSGITAGGGESQPLSVSATSNNTALIPAPTVSYTSPNDIGSLTLNPVIAGNGDAIILVTVEDGGTDKNLSTAGDNLKVVRDFKLTILPDKDIELFGTTGDDEFVATYTGNGTSSWSVTRNAVNVFTGDVPVTGKLVIDGGLGNDRITIVGRNVSDTIALNGNAINVNGFEVRTPNVEQRQLDGGNGDDEFRIMAGSASLIGGSGVDRVRGPAQDTTWNLSGAGIGSLVSGPISANFEAVETIICGAGNDGLSVGPSGTIAGSFYGGTGINSIGYDAWTSGVVVNLTTGHVSAIGGIVNSVVNVNGGAGNDNIKGNSADNILVGNGGNDILNGAVGSDDLRGGVGDDRYFFDPATASELDTLTELTGEGTDTVDFSSITTNVTLNLGSAVNQLVHTNRTLKLNDAQTFENAIGGTADDALTGNTLNNRLTGNGGNDTFRGDSGSDTMLGGVGDDSYVFSPVSGTAEFDLVTELVGQGLDTIDFTELTIDVKLSLGLTALQTVHMDRTLRLNSTSTFENAVGGSGNDVLTGNSLSNRLTGNAGNDTIDGGTGNDTLVGGLDNDTYTFGPASTTGELDIATELDGQGTDVLNFALQTTGVTLNLGLNTDQLVHTNRTLHLSSGSAFEDAIGGVGADTFVGNALNNRLTGNDGADKLTGGLGDDIMLGGKGDDSYLFGPAPTFAEADSVTELAAEGTDVLSFVALSAPVTVSLGSTAIQNVHTNRTIALNNGATFEDVIGGSGNDILTGNSVANKLSGNGGNDRLTGGLGSDSIMGGAGDDTYVFGATGATAEADTATELAGEGVDLLTFSSLSSDITLNLVSAAVQPVHTNRTLKLNNGVTFEDVTGGSGSDTLTGNSLNNHLIGGSGDDSLNGSTGSDNLAGGIGNDTYVFGAAAAGAEADLVTELVGQGTDVLNFSTLTLDVTLNLSSIAVQSIHTGRTLQLNSGGAFENIVGGSGHDIFTGNSLANVLTGNGGNDILVGLNGDDILQGLAGRDILIGGNGMDTVDGGSGDDILVAGRTTHDTNTANLVTIRTEWISLVAYGIRVGNLRTGVSVPVVALTAGSTVLDDAGADDSLTGGLGNDWYFRAVDDAITDLAIGELVDLL